MKIIHVEGWCSITPQDCCLAIKDHSVYGSLIWSDLIICPMERNAMRLIHCLCQDLCFGVVGSAWFYQHFGAFIWRHYINQPELQEKLLRDGVNVVLLHLHTRSLVEMLGKLRKVNTSLPIPRAIMILWDQIWGNVEKFFLSENAQGYCLAERMKAAECIRRGWWDFLLLVEANTLDEDSIGYWMYGDETRQGQFYLMLQRWSEVIARRFRWFYGSVGIDDGVLSKSERLRCELFVKYSQN